jgi:3-oxoacyl-(acyl-carrier-protein) synthase
VPPDELGCVLADGSAVPREDAAEVAAIRAALGGAAAEVPVTGAKAAISHLMGAAAPADVAVAIQAMAHAQVPPVANLDKPAPGFDLDFVTATSRNLHRPEHALVISRGMGGVNACLVLRRPQPSPA